MRRGRGAGVSLRAVASAAGLRVLGVSVPDVSDWREPLPQGQWSLFFAALAQRFELIDVVRPELSEAQRYVNLARSFHPDRKRWKATAGFNESVATKRTEAVQRALERYRGRFELIVQVQTVCGPGSDRDGLPYVIYTDNTMALTQRFYPAWAALSPRRAEWWMRYEAQVCRSAAAVFTFSEFARRSVIDDYGDSPEHVISIGAGANQLLDELGAKDYATRRALFVGVDFERKGGAVLLDAWRGVRERLPDAELVIAGPRGEPPQPLPPGVDWVGWVGRSGLAELYESASAFVLPSTFDPCPNVFREGMGYGLPCIGTDCCAIPEIIEDGKTGRVVPIGEPATLAAALIELLSDPAKAEAMGRAGHAEVLATGRWSHVVDRLAERLGGRELEPVGERGRA
jgi:alpha-maltose-1-phosphate synthase